MSVLSQIRQARQHTAAASNAIYDGGSSGGSSSSFPISKGYLATWILMTAVTMLFAGLSSAYIVLRGVPEWQNITVPSLVVGEHAGPVCQQRRHRVRAICRPQGSAWRRQAVACGERDSRASDFSSGRSWSGVNS